VSVFQQLLRVQEHDTAADRLRHRRGTLPELAELATVEESLARVEAALEEASARLAAVARQQRQLEDE
jgi:predicted  nucleic acid-binding Zn-ribbon protein